MLTPADTTTEGRLTRFDCGPGRRTIYEFLRSALEANRRDVKELRRLMEDIGVGYIPHYDDQFFEHEQRDAYFEALKARSLESTLVFCDPDIGMEAPLRTMKRAGFSKYLLGSDVANLARLTPATCVLVVYQHLQQDKRKRLADLSERAVLLGRSFGASSVASVLDNDIAFFITSRDSDAHQRACAGAKRHAKAHGREYRLHGL